MHTTRAYLQSLGRLYDNTVKFSCSGGLHDGALQNSTALHVAAVTYQAQNLLTSGPRFASILDGAQGRAHRAYPAAMLRGLLVLSNSVHMMVEAPAQQAVEYGNVLLGKLSSEWANYIEWPGRVFAPIAHGSLHSAESQNRCLDFILSHGSSADLQLDVLGQPVNLVHLAPRVALLACA